MDAPTGNALNSEVIIKEGVVEKKGHSAAFMMWPRLEGFSYMSIVRGFLLCTVWRRCSCFVLFGLTQ